MLSPFLLRSYIFQLRNIVFVSLMIFVWANGTAQSNKQVKVKKIEGQADAYYEIEEYIDALPLYHSLDSLNPNQGKYLYRLGVCYYNSHHKVKCLPYFTKCNELGYQEKELDFYLARGYHLNHKFDEAIKHYSTCKELENATDSSKVEMDGYIQMCEIGKELVEDSLELIIDNIGSVINSKYPDYVPVISSDESVLIFTSRNPTSTGGELDAVDGMFFEDIYISQKDSSGNWSTPKDMGSHINTQYHDACVGLAPDGRELFIYRSGQSKRDVGDVYVSKRSGEEWSIPERLGGHINTESWEPSATTTTDENTIIFSSDRPGGFGGIDLYIVKMDSNGQWAEPKNMGPVINSALDEDAPFIFADNKTLYFSSQSHRNMGGYDIFKSSFDEEKNEYTKPENVGYPINTADDDIYFYWNATGERGYFSSWREDSYGEKDIYLIHKPKENEFLIVMKGKVFDQETKGVLASTIYVVDIETNDTVGVYNSDVTTGKYNIKVAYGKKYSVIIQSKDYNYRQEFISIPDDRTSLVIKKDFYLDKFKVGQGIVLNNIFFDFDRATLRKESVHELEILYAFIKNYPNLKLEIGGHTDNFGKDGYNIRLSKRRAKAVVKYLVDKGIDKKRLIAKGYGETTPIATNDNPEGRQLNRRTELKIIDDSFKVVSVVEDINIQYKSEYIRGDDDDNSLDKSLYKASISNNSVGDSPKDESNANTTSTSKFIYSDENKPAVESLLKSQVNFLGSETKSLTEFSTKRLMNIVEAMKAYPTMKIAVITYSDLSEASNNIAEKRYASIRSILIKNGIDKERLASKILEEKDRKPTSQLYKIDFMVIGY